MTPRDNREALVAVAARVRISAPQMWTQRPHANSERCIVNLPGSGGIALGLHAGMSVDAVVGDHVMPGISVEGDEVHGLICLGNRVRGRDGGTVGAVAGKRGGLAPGFIPGLFVGVEAADEQLQRAVPGESLVVETYGRGLMLLDFPQVGVVNCSPRLLDALNVRQSDDSIEVAIRAEVAGAAAGAGLGSDVWIGDLEIDGGGDGLCFGDIVAFQDIDGRVSRFFRSGYVSVGVVSHGRSQVPGHGIGVTVVLSAARDVLRTHLSPNATVAPHLQQWSREEGM